MTMSTETSFTTAVSTKGQVVLGKALRDALDLHPGDRVMEEVIEDAILLRKIPSLVSLGGTLRKAGKEKSTDEIMREIDQGWD